MTATTTRPRTLSRRLRTLQQLLPSRDQHAARVSGPDEATLAHYSTILDEEASRADVPADLLKAICWYASGWRQYEPNGKVLTTPVGNSTSYGCMQLNDLWHPDAFPAALADAQSNIAYAARLLRWLFDQTHDWQRATMAFFGHDRRAEVAERRIRRYRTQRPWEARARTIGATATG